MSGHDRVWIRADGFSRYAESDPDRWRQLVGEWASHIDARWGQGIVLKVSWGSCCDHVPAYVQIKMRYALGGTIIFSSETWHVHHHEVALPSDVAEFVLACLDPDVPEDERNRRLAAHLEALRERRDAERLTRARAMKQRAASRRSGNEDDPD